MNRLGTVTSCLNRKRNENLLHNAYGRVKRMLLPSASRCMTMITFQGYPFSYSSMLPNPNFTIIFAKRVKVVRNACDKLNVDESLFYPQLGMRSSYSSVSILPCPALFYCGIRCFPLHVEVYKLCFMLGY